MSEQRTCYACGVALTDENIGCVNCDHCEDCLPGYCPDCKAAWSEEGRPLW